MDILQLKLFLLITLSFTESFSNIIQPQDNAPLPPQARKRRAATDFISICFDCDLVCVNKIAQAKYVATGDYFEAVINQLNYIFTQSNLPLQAKKQLLTTTTTDVVLDPTGTTSLQDAMDAYWRPKNVDFSLTKIKARLDSSCAMSILLTDDPVFTRNSNPAGLAYINSICTQWGYSISQWTSDIPVEAARIAHELAHSMYINHISQGDISFPTDAMVQLNCYPDVCKDKSGNCITVAQMTQPAPTMYSQCARAIFFTWRKKGYGSCLGDMVTYLNVGSLDDGSG